MPPTLDLSRTHKMIVAAPPRINLRRAASYSHDKGPLSSTSSRFGFNHLAFSSPPPSPGLPQLLPPRKRKSAGAPRPSRVLRAALYLAAAAALVYLAVAALRGGAGSSSSRARRGRSARDGLYIWPVEGEGHGAAAGPYEMVGRSSLPDHPTPVIVSDAQGRPRWTVSIPPNYAHFPLALDEYASLCAKSAVVANQVDELRGGGSRRGGGGGGGGSQGVHSSLAGMVWQTALGRLGTRFARLAGGPVVAAVGDDDDDDDDFVDVHEAEVAGYLPGSVSIGTLLRQQQQAGAGKPVCGRSLTVVLASADAGLGRTLMLLWMAYAQAQREGRGFFVDDAGWAYGRYADIFAPPPAPACRPPLRHEMLPCPRQARHLVLTMDTAGVLFGGGGGGDGGDDDGGAAMRQRFALARAGFEALFHLNADDAKHVARRAKQLRAKAAAPHGGDGVVSGGAETVPVVGLHVRRGDRRPVEFQYRDSYVPLNLYADRAYDAAAGIREAQQKTKTKTKGADGSAPPRALLVVASDDPMVYEANELAGAARAQEHIRLASKAPAPKPAHDSSGGGGLASSFHKFVDETFGWEGGFFAAMFWSLGSAGSVGGGGGGGGPRDASSAPGLQGATAPSAETVRIRSLVGRAYMLDLAVLAETSDAVVCAVSATGCRLLAVMLGWDAAIEQGRWINIDGDYGWWAVDV